MTQKTFKPLDGLLAYTPNGTKIVNTLECGIGTHQVTHFYRDEKGEITHEFGDNYSDGDYPETVVINGSVAFCDTDGTIWPEPALTYKTRQGKVVRKGLDLPPLREPSPSMAMSLGVNAERLRGDASHSLVEADWTATCNAQGWNEASQVLHLEGFIREMGLMPILAAYAKRTADEENAEAAALG